MNETPFSVNVPQGTIEDMRRRLTQTRWPDDFANEQWAYGTNLAYLQQLVGYWIDDYDWYRHQRRMNEFTHRKSTIQDIPIHFG